MPPRTRKATPPAPPFDGAQPSGPEAESAEPATPEPDAPGADGGADDGAAGEHGSAAGSPQESATGEAAATQLSPAAQALSALIDAPAIVYCWQSVTGGDSAPCRLCAPAGPPLGAGSFGCAHGQWVRVADEAP